MITPEKLGNESEFSDFKLKEAPKPVEHQEDIVIENPSDFREALSQAQLHGIDYVVVSKKMFAYLTNNKETPWINYGEPCVRVYCEGTKDYHESNEGLNPDKLMAKLKAEGRL
jgi:hypothetical protein